MRSRNFSLFSARWPCRPRTLLAPRGSRRSPYSQYCEFAAERTRQQPQFFAFRDDGTRREHVVLPLFDGTQNLQAPAAEQIQVEGKLSIDHPDQRQALSEQLAS